MLSFLNHPGFQPTHDTLQWSGKLQDTTPFQFAITGPACCRLSKQLPQGDQSNLVYSSLSIHTSDLAHVIMTFLLSTKSSHIPKKKKKKSTFDSAPWTLNGRITPSVYVQVFLRRASVDAVPVVGDPAQAAHPEHISHTNTHLSHLANPLHQSRTCSLPLNFQFLLGEDKHNFWFVFNLQSNLSVGHQQSTTSRTNTPRGVERGEGGVSIWTASCLHRSVIGTGQRDVLQLETATWGFCPWHVPAAPQKKSEHTFLIPKNDFLLRLSSLASGCCCSFTSRSQTVSHHAVFFFLPVRCRKSWSGLFVRTGVRGRKQVWCYVYTCDLQCRCEKYILLGIFDMHHLSKASIQIKSIPSCTAAGPAQCLHSTSRLQQLSAFACCGPEGTVSPQLHCFTHDHSMWWRPMYGRHSTDI